MNSAIKQKRQVSFQYAEYDYRRRKVLRNGGEVYTNSPYDCLWNDDKYYLIGYSEKHQGLVTFRIDRIVNLVILGEKSLPKPKDYRISDFANKVFRMYDGTLQEVELSCREPMMKQLVDHFGTDFEVLPAEEGYFTAKIKVSVSRTFFGWLFQLIFRFDNIDRIKIDTEPEIDWISDFCCNKSENSEFIIFDIGFYYIVCRKVALEKQVDFNA